MIPVTAPCFRGRTLVCITYDLQAHIREGLGRAEPGVAAGLLVGWVAGQLIADGGSIDWQGNACQLIDSMILNLVLSYILSEISNEY